MSMYGRFLAVDAAEIQALIASGASVTDWLLADTRYAATLDVDRSWHAIHYILCGDPWEPIGVVGLAVMGGNEFGEDFGHGAARWFAPEDVHQIAAALKPITVLAFIDLMKIRDWKDADIYSCNLQAFEEAEIAHVASHYNDMRIAYMTAAAHGQAMVAYIS
jgi:hypothetical protein